MEPEVNVEIPGVDMEGQDPTKKLLISIIPKYHKIQV